MPWWPWQPLPHPDLTPVLTLHPSTVLGWAAAKGCANLAEVVDGWLWLGGPVENRLVSGAWTVPILHRYPS